MTIDTGSLLSQSETHLDVFENVIEAGVMHFAIVEYRLVDVVAGPLANE
jgi:hypothetical protein